MIQELVYRVCEHLYFIPDRPYLKAVYLLKQKKWLRFDQVETFNEKLQYLKLEQTHPFYSKLGDKYAVRDYVARKLGRSVLTEYLWVGDDPADIPFDELPQRFVIKINCDCGHNIIVRDKRRIQPERVIRKLNKWLKREQWKVGRELHYAGIDKKIIVEEFLRDETHGVPPDFKFFVFNGRAEYIEVHMDRFIQHRRCFYNRNWEKMRFGYLGQVPTYKKAVPKPKSFPEMLRYAEILADDLPFVRVDFYEVDGKPFIGEMTLYPAGGFGKFFPDHEKIDQRLGAKIEIGETAD